MSIESRRMLPVVSNNGVFCVLPWVHLCASVDGVWGRCCVDNTMYYDGLYTSKEKPEFKLRTDSVGCLPQSSYAGANPEKTFDILEAFNSSDMRETRRSMLAGDVVPACQYCYEREAGGATSYRQLANKMFAEQTDLTALIEKTTEDGFLDEFPCYLDLRFGNACNLACIMCGFPTSSKWGKESAVEWLPAHIDPYKSDEELWKLLEVNADRLRRIYFAGGEPFLQRLHFKLLDLLIKKNVASKIDLAYNTNLTILPAGIFEKLKTFRSVDIGASCDGTGEIFESIRVGASWEKFVKNVRKTREHFPVRIAVTTQKDNIAHLQPLIEWAISEQCDLDLTNILMYPKELCIGGLGSHARRLFAAEYDELADRYRERGYPKIADDLTNIVRFLQQSHTRS